MLPVLTLLREPHHGLSASRARSLRLEVIPAASWADVHLLARTHLAGIALLDPYFGGELAIDEISVLRSAFPTLPIVAMAEYDANRCQDIVLLAQRGVTQVVHRRDPLALSRFVRVTESAAQAEAEIAFVADCRLNKHRALEGLIRRFFRDPASCERLANVGRIYGPHLKTLRTHLREEGLPSPEQFVAWMRLYVVVQLLRDNGRSTRSACATAGFRDVRDLHSVSRRYVGVGIRALRCASGLDELRAAFRSRHR